MNVSKKGPIKEGNSPKGKNNHQSTIILCNDNTIKESNCHTYDVTVKSNLTYSSYMWPLRDNVEKSIMRATEIGFWRRVASKEKTYTRRSDVR